VGSWGSTKKEGAQRAPFVNLGKAGYRFFAAFFFAPFAFFAI
jgi:hypothetical protein